MAVADEVKTIVRLLMQRPITEEIAREVETHEGFEHLEIEDGNWVGFDEDPYMSGEEHGWIEAKLAALFTLWALENRAGRVYPGDTNFVLSGNRETLEEKRRPDVAFVRRERVVETTGYLFLAPDLAIEIISPTEKPYEIRGKLNVYLRFGVQRVWQVYPQTQEIVVTFADGTSRTYRPSDTLTDPELLPGFNLEVAMVFEA